MVIMKHLISKRYKDIFAQYIHKGEPTPLSVGTIAVLGLCFLLLIIATFSQFSFNFAAHNISYSPLIPIMLFIIYILGINYSFLLFILYLLTGFFVWPIFVFGGGVEFVQNYLFGYIVGFALAIFIAGFIFNLSQTIKTRLVATFCGILTIHFSELFYCIILAILKVIKFSLVIPIISKIILSNILLDILFSFILILLAPYIKNVLWTCMKPKYETKKQKERKQQKAKREKISKNIRKRH